MIKAIVGAALPLIFAILAALGVNITPEDQAVINENITMILVAVGALGSIATALTPSVLAALKFGTDAK